MATLLPILTLLFIVVSVALVLIVLVQRPQGGGLTGAFGGGAGADTAFGGRTGDALTVATITAFTIYLLLAIGLNITTNMMNAPAAAPAANTTTDGTTQNAPMTPSQPIPLTDAEKQALLGGSQPAATPPTEEPKPLPEGVTPVPGGAPSTTDPNATPATAPAPTPAPAPAPAPGGE